MHVRVLIIIILSLIFGNSIASVYHGRVSLQEGKAQAQFYTCEIEIINDACSNVTIYGRYDDGVLLTPFNIYSYEYSHYINLFYDNYCHSGVYLTIVTFSGQTIFAGYVFTGSTVHTVTLLDGQVKVWVK